MKTEFLKGFGLSDEDIQKILAENGKDVEREKAKTEAATEEAKEFKKKNEDLSNKVKELSEKADSVDEYKSQLEKIKGEIEEKEKLEKQEAEDKALTEAIEAVLGDKEFTSDYVRRGLIADMKTEIAKEENKSKSYADIYEGLTKDKPGIFANPNKPADMKGMGDVETGGTEKITIPKIF